MTYYLQLQYTPHIYASHESHHFVYHRIILGVSILRPRLSFPFVGKIYRPHGNQILQGTQFAVLLYGILHPFMSENAV